MELKHIVLHQVKKERGTAPELNLSDHLLDESNFTVIEFMERLIKNFGQKNPTYGRFEEDTENYPFQRWVKNYRKNNDFLMFSHKSMDTLKAEMLAQSIVGGYILFAHYIEKQIEYLVTIMLDKSLEFTINDENLNLKRLKTLAIDKMARGNRINLTKWEQDTEETYLAFIKGTRTVSDYFQKFIGNTDLTSSKVNGKNLKQAINKFMRVENFTEAQREKAKREIANYIEIQRKSDQDVHLSSISAYINASEPEKFIEFVRSDETLEVSGSFRVNQKSDLDLQRNIVSEKGYKLEFEEQLKRDRKIIRDGDNIVIKHVPVEILNEEFGENE